MFSTSTNTCTNLLTTTWVVISHSKCWGINWQLRNKQSGISQLASQHSQRIPLHKWILRPLVLTHYTSMLSLQLHSTFSRNTTYCPTLWTREWYQLISLLKSNLSSFTTMLIIHMGSNHTQPSQYQLSNSHIPQRMLRNYSTIAFNAIPLSW